MADWFSATTLFHCFSPGKRRQSLLLIVLLGFILLHPCGIAFLDACAREEVCKIDFHTGLTRIS